MNRNSLAAFSVSLYVLFFAIAFWSLCLPPLRGAWQGLRVWSSRSLPPVDWRVVRPQAEEYPNSRPSKRPKDLPVKRIPVGFPPETRLFIIVPCKRAPCLTERCCVIRTANSFKTQEFWEASQTAGPPKILAFLHLSGTRPVWKKRLDTDKLA